MDGHVLPQRQAVLWLRELKERKITLLPTPEGAIFQDTLVAFPQAASSPTSRPLLVFDAKMFVLAARPVGLLRTGGQCALQPHP